YADFAGCYCLAPTGAASMAPVVGLGSTRGQVAALVTLGAVVLSGVQARPPCSAALSMVVGPQCSSKDMISTLLDRTTADARADQEFAAMEASAKEAERRAIAATEADAGDWIYSDA